MASPTQWTRQQKFSRGIWAVAFAAIVVVGSLTGAQLKSDEQKTETIKKFRQDTPARQIALLEEQKKHLRHQRAQIERKMDVFQERVQERQDKK
ncbi:hypothetical protein K4F52_009310 [Lecanicillium sp. MT-2017a]|nr:hypothetical protein K4F52_009310 [Lecanicillium sp. MT-2017a]